MSEILLGEEFTGPKLVDLKLYPATRPLVVTTAIENICGVDLMPLFSCKYFQIFVCIVLLIADIFGNSFVSKSMSHILCIICC